MDIPKIKRARGYRLYTDKNRRLLDLYCDSGKAFMGHRAGNLSKTLKAAIDKGVLADYNSIYEIRYRNALKKTFPSYKYFYLIDSFQIEKFRKKYPQVRPIFLEDYNYKTIIPTLPFPGDFSPNVICSKVELKKIKEKIYSPVVMEAASRNLYDYLKFVEEKKDIEIPKVKTKNFIQVNSLGEKTEKFDCYLKYIGKKSDYNILWESALEKGVLLPPDLKDLAIIPFELSNGELKLIQNTL